MNAFFRFLIGAVGAGIWAYGLVMFINGDQLVGGAVVLGGGLLVVAALRRGWDGFFEGLANWVYFR